METVGIIGVGNLGSALARGWLRRPDGDLRLLLFDADRRKLDPFCDDPRVDITATAVQVAAGAGTVVVSIKPGDMDVVLRDLVGGVGPGQTVISTAAGVTLDRLRADLEVDCHLFRIMPNLAVAYGEGVIALAPEEGTPPEAVSAVRRLFGGMGLVETLPEGYFDAVTALTGSGPGFLAVVLEGLEDGGVHSGLPRPVSRAFVQQMALGTARVLGEEGVSPANLKDQVASPGGTTIAGLAVLEDRGVRGALLRAVQAATERGRQL